MSISYIPEMKSYKEITPFRRFVLQSFPWINETFDALTNYELMGKIIEYLNDVIKNGKITEENVTSLYNGYLEIQNYLNDLDLQDEINNKLDEMAEDGTLQEIIGSYLDANALWCFDSVNDMKTATNLIDGSFAKTMGYYSKNDGGMAIYKIRTITNNDVVDNMLIIQMSNENLVAELIEKNTINIKQLGAKNSDLNTNNNDIVAFLNCAYNNFNEIVIPSGEYYLSEFSPNSIGIQNKIIRGTGGTKIYTANGFIFNGNATEPYAQRVMQVYIKNINFYGQGRSNSNRQGNGVTFNHFGECYIDDCYFAWFNQGLKLVEGSEMTIKNTIILSCNQGTYIERNTGDLDAVTFDSCAISNSSVAVLIESVRGLNFNNCILINSSVNDNGVKIQNTYANSEQINFTNCEFENNTTGQASIISGVTDNTYTTQFLNIIGSKFTMFGNYAIDLIRCKRLNIYNTLFTFSYPYNIRIGANCESDLKIVLKGCAEVLPLYIQDNRNTFYGDFIPSEYNRINHFADMKHSVTEFSPSTTSLDYNNGVVSFSANGYLGFDIKEGENFKYEDGVYIVAVGTNLQNFKAVAGGSAIDIPSSSILQTLGDGQQVKKGYIKRKDLTSLRFQFINGTTVSKILIYGHKSNPLPLSNLTNITLAKYIGEPTKGDVISLKNSSLTGSIGVYNGTTYTIL